MTSLTGYIQGLGNGEKRTVEKTGKTVRLSVYDNIDRVIVFNEAGETSQTGTPTPSNPVDIVGIGTRRLDGTYSVSIDYDDGDEHYGTITASGLAYPLYEGDVLDFVNGKVIRNNGYKVFDGTENWITAGYSPITYYGLSISDMTNGNLMVGYCNRLIGTQTAYSTEVKNSIRFGWSSKYIYISVSDDFTLAAWKTYISNNETYIVYPLATSTDEYITLSGDISDIGTATVTADGTLTVKYDKVEMAVRKYSSPPEWSKLGYTETPLEVLSAFDYAKYIKDNWTYTSGTIPKYTNDKRLFFFPNVNIDESRGYNAMFEASNLMHIEPCIIGEQTSSGDVNCQTMFKQTLIEKISINGKDSSQLFNTNNMFFECKNLKEAGINLKSNNCQSMFYGCLNLKKVNGNFDTSSASNFSTMFQGCSNLTSVPNLDTTSATNMNKMFVSCSSLETAPQMNTANVTNFSQMFWSCTGLKNLPLFAFTSATNLSNMFQATGSNLTEQSRDNLLHSLTSATAYTGTKTLAQLAFTSSMYSASSWQSLTHYQDFVNAGWTIGYS